MCINDVFRNLARGYLDGGESRPTEVVITGSSVADCVADWCANVLRSCRSCQPRSSNVLLLLLVDVNFCSDIFSSRGGHGEKLTTCYCPRGHVETLEPKRNRWGLLPVKKGGHRIGLVLDSAIEEDLLLRHIQARD